MISWLGVGLDYLFVLGGMGLHENKKETKMNNNISTSAHPYCRRKGVYCCVHVPGYACVLQDFRVPEWKQLRERGLQAPEHRTAPVEQCLAIRLGQHVFTLGSGRPGIFKI